MICTRSIAGGFSALVVGMSFVGIAIFYATFCISAFFNRVIINSFSCSCDNVCIISAYWLGQTSGLVDESGSPTGRLFGKADNAGGIVEMSEQLITNIMKNSYRLLNGYQIGFRKTNPELPEEILIEIFSRLSPEGVGRMRCLSKSWNTKLSTTQFIKYHITSNTHKPYVLLYPPGHNHYLVIAPPISEGNFSKELNIGTLDPKILGSSNGLILLGKFFKDQMIVLNPITLQKFILPYIGYDHEYGFGYDCSTDDYKIVAPYTFPEVGSDEVTMADTKVSVYSLKTGRWNMDKISCEFRFNFESWRNTVLFNGAIHWVCRNRKLWPVIAAFDIVNERFYEVPSPVEIESHRPFTNEFNLGVLEGCLCLVNTHCKNVKWTFETDDRDIEGARRDVTSFWVMKEYGSWTKFSVDVNPKLEIIKPIGFFGYEEVVFITKLETLVSYNLKENIVLDLGIEEYEYEDGETFVGSLVSPIFNP